MVKIVQRKTIGAAVALALTLGAGGAYAKEQSDNPTDEAAILSSAKIPLSEAMRIAEQATGGKASGIGIEDQDGMIHFEVTIVKNAVRQKVLVDPNSGNVVQIAAADDESDDEGDGESENGSNSKN